jgi:uncharacterized protein (DUF4415 family)
MRSKPSRAKARRAKATRAPAVLASKTLADDSIDTSDIPPLGPDFFRQAVRNPYYRPVKRLTTVRLDADVLAWLRAQGPGYQTRINALLRAAMEQATGASER